MKYLNILFLFTLGCTPENPEKDLPADNDGDGLSNDEEAELGTDADVADSDGDGLTDSLEVESGSNPLSEHSKSYEQGNYIVGQCENGVLEPTGPSSETTVCFDEAETECYTWPIYKAGDVAENFTLTDQYGQSVDLYSFCGKVTMLVFGASWCPPCQELASGVQEIQNAAPDQIQIIELLIENEDYGGGVVETADQIAWATSNGMSTIPVLDADYSAAEWYYDYESDMGIPTTVMIGPDMKIINVDRGRHDPTQYIE